MPYGFRLDNSLVKASTTTTERDQPAGLGWPKLFSSLISTCLEEGMVVLIMIDPIPAQTASSRMALQRIARRARKNSFPTTRPVGG